MTLTTFDAQLSAFKKINSDAVEPMQRLFLPQEEVTQNVEKIENEEESETLTKRK